MRFDSGSGGRVAMTPRGFAARAVHLAYFQRRRVSLFTLNFFVGMVSRQARCYDALLSAGDCSLYDGRVLHCGGANTTPQTAHPLETAPSSSFSSSSLSSEAEGEAVAKGEAARVLFYVTVKANRGADAEESANSAARSLDPRYAGVPSLGAGQGSRPSLTLAALEGAAPWPLPQTQQTQGAQAPSGGVPQGFQGNGGGGGGGFQEQRRKDKKHTKGNVSARKGKRK